MTSRVGNQIAELALEFTHAALSFY